MTEIENKKVQLPKAAFTRTKVPHHIQSSVGFPVIVPPVTGLQPPAETHALRSPAVRIFNPAGHLKENMTIKALVMSDRSDEYTGKRGLVKQQIITVMDQSEGERLAQPIKYAMSDEEKNVHAGKL